jgi:uncharacterized membrane protein
MGRSWKKRRHFPPDPVSNPQQPASRSGTRTEIALTAERFAGPLPHPDILERYDKIVPGLAERIVKMAEGQSQHRQGLEHMVVQSNTRNERRGQVFGFLISVLVIGGSIYLIDSGKSIEGVAAIVVNLVSLAGVFIYGRRRKERDLAEKRRQMDES